MLSLLAQLQKKLQLDYKTNITQKEPSENLAVWKSNNQGFKEATYIQMGRRGRDMQRRSREVESHREQQNGWSHIGRDT